MSEAELHILKARMHEGRRAKAIRGELVMGLPRGFVLRPSGEVALDPDEQVRATIRLVFDLFERRRSVRGVLCHLADHEIQLPDRVRSGPHKGEVRWNRPNQATLSDMLRHPAYAGAYVYGRRRMDRRCQLSGKPHSGRRFIRSSEQWTVLRRDCWPAYIDWQTYTQNQEQMAANRSKHDGVPRGGAALVGGLIRCGQCGRRMTVAYRNNGREARYQCSQLATTFGGPRCQSISAQPVDGLIGQLILAALAPSALEVSLQLAEDLDLERVERARQWVQRLERARYETALAKRRYEAVDPQNRLVARTLERDWEAALAAEQTAQAEHERELARQPAQLQAAEREANRSLAEDVPALWHASTTKAADRQAIVRLMLDVVAVRIERNSERVEVCCDWAGGMQTRHDLVRTVRRFEQLHEFDELLAHIRQLRAQGCPASVVAEEGPMLKAGGRRSAQHSTSRWCSECCSVTGCRQDGPDLGDPCFTPIGRRIGPCRSSPHGSASIAIPPIAGCVTGDCQRASQTRGDQRIWIVQMTEAELESFTSGRTDPLPKPDLHSKPGQEVIMEKRSRMSGSSCARTTSPTVSSTATRPSSVPVAAHGMRSSPILIE